MARLDLAAATEDVDLRRRALTFMFVGGGYAGIEALAELEDMARYALRYVPGVEPSEMRWVLIEAASRIMPEVSVRLSATDWEPVRMAAPLCQAASIRRRCRSASPGRQYSGCSIGMRS